MYECVNCNYKTNRKFNLDKHFNSEKHKKTLIEKKIYSCSNCGKIYKYYRAYTNHNCMNDARYRKCEMGGYPDTSANTSTIPVSKTSESTPDPGITNHNIDDSSDMKELLNKVLQENQQIKKDLELAKKVKCQYNFNINIFLQNECDDAINWFDFIESINIGEHEINDVMKTNLTSSMINVLTDEMNKLGKYRRPIHCLDLKRKKLCIKNNNRWIKDQLQNQNTINKGEKILQHKYIKAVSDWDKIKPQEYGCNKKNHWNNPNSDIYVDLCNKVYNDVNANKIKRSISNTTYTKPTA